MVINVILIFIGGGIGAILRYFLNIVGEIISKNYFSFDYPIGTFAANLLGSFTIGLLFGIYLENILTNESLKLFLIVGLLGGFTTFSSFSLEVFNMILNGDYLISSIYIVLSVSIALLFTFFGFKLSSVF